MKREISRCAMEDRIKLSMLLDIYGNLLTEKQKSIMDLYYNCDLSLSEISEHTSTSRQAVYDIIRRCHKLLLGYEIKLELMKKSLMMKKKVEVLMKKIDEVETSGNKKLICDIKKYIKDNIK